MAQIVKRTTAGGQVRYDVRIRINGRVVTKTSVRKHDADAYATATEADKLRGVAVDPRRARITLRAYTEEWLSRRTDLAERTYELHTWLAKTKLYPTLGDVPLGKLSPSMVRAWNATLAQRVPSTAAKAYRLLRVILGTAMSDEIITRNPCQLKGAGSETAAERPVVSVAEVAALIEAMPEELRVVIHLAILCQLRRAEIMGIAGWMSIPCMAPLLFARRGPARWTAALWSRGRRAKQVSETSPCPPMYRRRSLITCGSTSTPSHAAPSSPSLRGSSTWPGTAARTSIGRPNLRLHDLRHTGLTLAGATGATVRELMHRGGHSTPTAAIRYQHATRDRDRVIADALAELVKPAAVVPIGGKKRASKARR